MTTCRLESHVTLGESLADVRLTMKLYNLSDAPLSGAVLGLSTITRMAGDASVFGADFRRRVANYHEFAMPDGLSVPPGAAWEFGFTGSAGLVPAHRVDGPKSAVLLTAEGPVDVPCGDLSCAAAPSGPLKDVPAFDLEEPLFLIPWPAQMEGISYGAGGVVGLAHGSPEEFQTLEAVAALHRRLYPQFVTPLAVGCADIALSMKAADLPEEAFSLEFANGTVLLTYGAAPGRFYGLIALAQMAHAALSDPARFYFPVAGRIEDEPRFGWRGSHVDVSRHFWSSAQIRRFLDTMAWGRMNILQWHLSDDEGWRIEIKAFPELTTIGARRGPEVEMPGQYAGLSATYEGHYSQDQIAEVVAHAAGLHIDVVPEIDIPGHCAAVLTALPQLRDPDEPEGSYHSVQGYPNNALNPAMPETWDFVEKVLAEVAALFPAGWVHVGADEVAHGAWLDSPKVKVSQQREGLQTTAMLQSWFLRRVQKILRSHGKELAGWDEVSHGGGVETEGTLLVAWQRPDLVPTLVAQGYRVIASPGQAYYLDMVQAAGWNEPGTQWGGVVTPEASYAYDPEGGLPEDRRGALAGIQSCIWCEHIWSPEIFNHMVYPRLHGVAEAGWTPQENRSWRRFATLSHLMPRL